MKTGALTSEELARYSRHLTLPDVGFEGQRRLKHSRVLLIGAGGLGSPAALYLTAAGIGHIGIIDADVVDRTNLQRQILHSTSAIGRRKVDSARERLADLNPNVEIITYAEPFTSDNAMRIAGGYDLIVDGTDNFPTRYLSNDVAVFLGIPNVYGSIYRFEGQVSVFWAENGPCYRCLYPDPPPPGSVPDCAEGGVLGILPGVIGAMQATEAIKLLVGIGEPLVGRLLIYDALRMRTHELRLRRDPECPVCGEHPTITEPIDYEQFCGVPGRGDAIHSTSGHDTMSRPEITVEELARARESGEPHVLIDVREEDEYLISNIGGRLIPLSQLRARTGEIPRQGNVYVHCRMGGRSGQAVDYLRSLGYTNVFNVVGGINAWAERVDTSVVRY